MSEITLLLQRMHAGEVGARNALFATAYKELCVLARAKLRLLGGRDAMLETRSLVNECYLRYARAGELRAANRPAFFCYASRIMQSVILDAVRARQAQRRPNAPHVEISDEIAGNLVADEAISRRLLEALEALEEDEAPLGQVILMRYFGGYTEREIANALGVTERTVQRHWKKGRLLLKLLLKE